MTTDIKTVTAAFVVIGSEILSGRTQDANIKVVAERLAAKGITLSEVRIIDDNPDQIITTINQLRHQFDHVLTSGGIGPTHDDITAGSIAKAFGVELCRDPRAVELLTKHYAPSPVTDARLKMAEIPVGAELIANPISKAPGFRIGNVAVMAGVPNIMRAMLDDLLPRLAGGSVVESRTITAAIGESRIAVELEAIQAQFLMVQIGSYPYYRGGGFGTSLVLRSAVQDKLDKATLAVRKLLDQMGAEIIDAPPEE
ncbi:MAG: molybdopterin-binding protein [Candidatus Pacebacteria bacterium]|nr:molybdopterin-binding protein [Candidatus Paceibacterota bacterium]